LSYRRLQLLGFRITFGAGPRFALQFGQPLLGAADTWLELVSANMFWMVTVSANMVWMVTKTGCSYTGPGSWTNQSGACVPGSVASSSHTAGIQAGMADGSVHFVAQGVSQTTWWYALTCDQGDILGSNW
jgi:hypothetical protein